jgi:hypothetical protein
MSPVEQPPAERRDRVVLPARTPRGVIKVTVTKLPNDRIEFAPHLNGACVFAVEEDELIKILMRWI